EAPEHGRGHVADARLQAVAEPWTAPRGARWWAASATHPLAVASLRAPSLNPHCGTPIVAAAAQRMNMPDAISSQRIGHHRTGGIAAANDAASRATRASLMAAGGRPM